MRDVIDGMEELANMSGFTPRAGDCLKILSIEPAETYSHAPAAEPVQTQQETAEIIPIKRKKQAAA